MSGSDIVSIVIQGHLPSVLSLIAGSSPHNSKSYWVWYTNPYVPICQNVVMHWCLTFLRLTVTAKDMEMIMHLQICDEIIDGKKQIMGDNSSQSIFSRGNSGMEHIYHW